MKVLIVPPVGPCEVRDIDGKLEEFQKIVGGYIEHARCAGDVCAYLNEDGHLEGLPENPRATSLVRIRGVSIRYPVRGAMVCFGLRVSPDGYGNFESDVPDEFIARVMQMEVPE